MVRVDQFDEDLVRSRRQAVDSERLAASIRPVPRRIIDRYVGVANAWRYGERRPAEHPNDPQVLGAVLNYELAMRQRLRQRRIDDDLGGWFDGRGSATSQLRIPVSR